MARRYAQITAQCLADLGGEATLSETQLQLARRFAMLSALAELAEGEAMSGKPMDHERYTSIVGVALRIGTRLGLQRVAREINGQPSLREYIAALDRAHERGDVTDAEVDEVIEHDEQVEHVEHIEQPQENVADAQVPVAGPVTAPAPDMLAQRDLLVPAPAPATPPNGAVTPAVAIHDLAREANTTGKTFVELLEERRLSRLATTKL
jgi:hypothetical protein